MNKNSLTKGNNIKRVGAKNLKKNSYDIYNSFIQANRFDEAFEILDINTKNCLVPVYNPTKKLADFIDWEKIDIEEKIDGKIYFYFKDRLLFIVFPNMKLIGDYVLTEWGIRLIENELVPFKSRQKDYKTEGQYLIEVVVYRDKKSHAYLVLSTPDYVYPIGYVFQQGGIAKKAKIQCPDECALFSQEKSLKIAFPIDKETFQLAFEDLTNLYAKGKNNELSFSSLNNNCTSFVAGFLKKYLDIEAKMKIEALHGVFEVIFYDTNLLRWLKNFDKIIESNFFTRKIKMFFTYPLHYLVSVIFCAGVNISSKKTNLGSFFWKDIFFQRCFFHSPHELGRWIIKQNLN